MTYSKKRKVTIVTFKKESPEEILKRVEKESENLKRLEEIKAKALDLQSLNFPEWPEIKERFLLKFSARLKKYSNKKFEYTIRISSEVKEGYLIAIKSGLVPEIIISDRFIIHLATKKFHEGELYVNAIIRQCHDNALKVKTTLLSLVPIGTLKVLREDLDNKFLTGYNEQKYLRFINPSLFTEEVIHTVTLTDKITFTNVTVSNTSLAEARNQAQKKLQILIAENQDLSIQHDEYWRKQISKPNQPEEILIRDVNDLVMNFNTEDSK